MVPGVLIRYRSGYYSIYIGFDRALCRLERTLGVKDTDKTSDLANFVCQLGCNFLECSGDSAFS